MRPLHIKKGPASPTTPSSLVKLTRQALEAYRIPTQPPGKAESRTGGGGGPTSKSSTTMMDRPNGIDTAPLPSQRGGSVPPLASEVDASNSSVSGMKRGGQKKSEGVRFRSDLDDAPVEACLEYLTRPHSSWDSAIRTKQRIQDRIEEHQASAIARSLEASRRTSLASSFAMESTAGSAATAPAGFPRSSSNASKSCRGSLQRIGRLASSSASLNRASSNSTKTGKKVENKAAADLQLFGAPIGPSDLASNGLHVGSTQPQAWNAQVPTKSNSAGVPATKPPPGRLTDKSSSKYRFSMV